MTSQGSVISPTLANLYLHYVLDLWVDQWRRKKATGDVIIVRYADDGVLGFQHQEDTMLGEMIGETTGRRIVRRVLSTDPLRVEVSFEDSGKMLGVNTTGFGTYTSAVRPDGSIYGEGEGAFMTQDGEPVTWKGSGQGTFKEKGAISYRGILYYRTASQKLARLNTVPTVFEYEIDPEGKTHAKFWEWK